MLRMRFTTRTAGARQSGLIGGGKRKRVPKRGQPDDKGRRHAYPSEAGYDDRRRSGTEANCVRMRA
jgi:hypothetical protein